MREEFQKHKTSDKIKWVITGIAFLLVFVMLIGMCLQLFGQGKVKPSEWFKKFDTEQTTPEENGGAVIGESVSNGIKLMSARIEPTAYAENGIAPQADSAYTLTATVEPANADDTAVDWTVTWTNASSSWASGKTVTDYVTITPKTDGALTATLVCKQAFGEQVTVTVIYRHNPVIRATTTADYRERLTGANYIVTVNGENYTMADGVAFPYENNANLQVNLVKSAGTVAGSFESSVSVRFTDEFVAFVAEVDRTCEFSGIYSAVDTTSWKLTDTTFSFITMLEGSLYEMIFSVASDDGYTKYAIDDLLYYLKAEFTGNIFVFDFTVKDKNTNSTVNNSYSVNLDKSSMMIYASALSLGSGVTF